MTSDTAKNSNETNTDSPEEEQEINLEALLKKGYRITPMFEQYLLVKAKYRDCLLFFRMGDFYELFFEDAKICSRELQLTLTSRSHDISSKTIPMCGMPWHSAETYTRQLVDKGYTIAICDQVEDPREARGLVKREVTRIITPGTLIEDVNLTAKSHNFLGAAIFAKGRGAFVWADISTGHWSGLEGTEQNIWQWVLKYEPRELILEEQCALPAHFDKGAMRLVRQGKNAFDMRQCLDRLFASQKVADLAALGMQSCQLLPRAAGALLAYLAQTQKTDAGHLQPFKPADTGRCMIIDEVTERNLEIFRRLNGMRGKGTLINVMDDTITPMGGRLLEDMLRSPLRSLSAIEAIQEAVAFFAADDALRKELRKALRDVSDMERMVTRITLNRTSPKDLVSLRSSLAALPALHKILKNISAGSRDAGGKPVLPQSLKTLISSWDNMSDCARLLESALADNPPAVITEGGLLKRGYNEELDKWLEIANNAEKMLHRQCAEDQKRAGSIKLKLGNNKVFGYYYEITKAQDTRALPADFVRRQTLVNAERYTTQGLKKLEDDILQAHDKSCSLEYQLFSALREQAASWHPRIMAMSQTIASLDYWQGLASMARKKGWTRPRLTEDANIFIQNGRHPVVEDMQGRASFVPNSFILDDKRRLCLLTGPNMSGKSTVLRQVALLCLMAQAGSFVPADKAQLGMVDRLFSRVGASDNLAQGQSTFMVEMMETARILRQATKRSLIILDEIGRGTSTYDGLALAWAVAEELAAKFNGSLRTLFATHYHELTELEGQVPGVFTMNIAIREFKKDIVFLHKLVPGPADRSLGVEVARLSGVPQSVVSRARELLERFEALRSLSHQAFHNCMQKNSTVLPGLQCPDSKPAVSRAEPGRPAPGQREHPFVQIIKDLDPDNLTPMKALALIMEWKKIWGTDSEEGGADAAELPAEGSDAQSEAAPDAAPGSSGLQQQ